MKSSRKIWLRDGVLTVSLLFLAFLISLAVDRFSGAEPLIPLFFVAAVFLISQLTEGYFFGILSSFVSVLSVNFLFTYPYLAFDFISTENAVSALILTGVSISTCALTQKIKRHEMLRSEFDREKMRGNLLRAVSHDLRTPLTGIYGASSTIIDNYEALTDEDKKQMLLGIREDSQWLIRMVENLLSITKMENENLKLSKSPVVVEELIGSALGKFQKRYAGQNVELELPQELILVSVDPILMEQVLVNLLENAVQHAEGMEHLKLQVTAKEKTVTFLVADDGCGVPKDTMERLFTGTVHPDSAHHQQKHNMGIGLSLCATILRAHGGRIWAEPNKPRGMRFLFTLEAEEIIYES